MSAALVPPGVEALRAKIDGATLVQPRPSAYAPDLKDADRGRLVEVPLADLARSQPEPPRFIVPGWLPEGEVTLFAADGGTGKSMLSLELAVCTAAGRPWHGLQVQQRDAVFVSFEDRAETLHWRLHRLCSSLGVRVADLASRLTLFDGTEATEPWYARSSQARSGATDAYRDAAARIGSDRLVVVDSVADVFAENENARAEVKGFIRLVRGLAGARGAVLLIAHVDKGAVRAPGDAPGYSGSTAWNNSVRCRWYMRPEVVDDAPTGDMRIEVRKSNLGPDGETLLVRFDSTRQVFVTAAADGQAAHLDSPKRKDERAAVLAVIEDAWRRGNPIPVATGGTRTGYSVARTFPAYPQSARGQLSKRRFDHVVNELLNANTIEAVEVPRLNRKRTEVFRPTGQAAPQLAECAPQTGGVPGRGVESRQ